jgi:Kef-type K+ transport system membrane component KefB
VETFAQFGVVFLLFALGLEFSLTKVLKKSLDVVLSPIYLFPK